jgi:hypothetical protein
MPLLGNAFAGSSPHPKTRCPSIRPRQETGIHDSFALRLAGRRPDFDRARSKTGRAWSDQSPLPTIRDAQKAAGVRLPSLLTRAKGLSSALLTAALLVAAAGFAAPPDWPPPPCFSRSRCWRSRSCLSRSSCWPRLAVPDRPAGLVRLDCVVFPYCLSLVYY